MLSNSAGSEEAAADFDEFSTSKPSLEYLKAEKNFSLNFLSGQNNGPERKERAMIKKVLELNQISLPNGTKQAPTSLKVSNWLISRPHNGSTKGLEPPICQMNS